MLVCQSYIAILAVEKISIIPRELTPILLLFRIVSNSKESIGFEIHWKN